MYLAIDLSMLTYLNYIFYLILVLAILAGFLKGLKKTIYTFVTMAIFYIVFFLTIDSVVQMLWTMDLSWLGPTMAELDPALSGFTSFEASLGDLLNFALGGNVSIDTSSAEVLALATGVGQFVVKIVWTILYFTVVLLVWKIITWIIGAIFVRNKDKASKNRGLGAAFGVLNGAMAVFVMMIMLGGIMSVAGSALTLMQDSGTQTMSFDSRNSRLSATTSIIPLADPGTNPDLTVYVDDLQSMVDAYDNNPIVKLGNSITTASSINPDVEVPLNIDLFDRVLSFDINNAKVGIRYELNVFSEAASVILNSDYYTTQDITDITGDDIREVFAYISQSNLIVELMPVAIEVASNMYDLNLSDAAKTELYGLDFEQGLSDLGNIAGGLFDILSGAGFIGEGTQQVQITETTVTDLFDNIADSDLVEKITEYVLLPMLENSEGDFAAYITVPDDFNISNEYRALGAIFGQIIAADIPFSDLANADVTVLLDAASQIDFTVLTDSALVSSALINILSGQTTIEGLDVLTVPSDLTDADWYDQSPTVHGELYYILDALNVLADNIADLDLANLDFTVLTGMADGDIDRLFNSYIIRATVSDLIASTQLDSIGLIVPNTVYDSAHPDYIAQTELTSLLKAIKLVLGTSGDTFDVTQALSLTETQITNILLDSEIIAATIGKIIYDMGDSTLVIPDHTLTTIAVGTDNVSVIDSTEVTNILLALAVLDLQSLDSVSFDAGIIDNLANDAETDLDDAKIAQLLGSDIIHATVSDMIFGLDKANSGVLVIPETDAGGTVVSYTDEVELIDYVTKAEIGSILKGLYSLGVSNFDNIDLETTSDLLPHLSVLLNSGIIHATISDVIIGLGSLVTIPITDELGGDIYIEKTDGINFIDATELVNLFTALDLLGFDPSSLDMAFDFTVLDDPNTGLHTNDAIILASAIMQATISNKILTLGSGSLIVPEWNETEDTQIVIDRGTLGNEIPLIIKDELYTLFDAMVTMGFTDFNDVNAGVDSDTLLANDNLIYTSSILQATISNQIIGDGTGALIVPDTDETLAEIRIAVGDVTYIRNSELANFIAAIKLLPNQDFGSFSMNPSDIYALDLNTFFDSYIMQATVSKFVIDQADYEDDPYVATALVVPHALREVIVVNASNTEQVEKSELIKLINSLEALGMDNFTDSMSITNITGAEAGVIDTVLLSGSFHVTIDRMLRQNNDIVADIPTLAVELTPGLYGVDPITTATEIRDFIIAVNTLGEGDFTSTTISLGDFAALDDGQRQTVLASMIIRNKITPVLELTFVYVNTDYELDNPANFLKATVAKASIDTLYPQP